MRKYVIEIHLRGPDNSVDAIAARVGDWIRESDNDITVDRVDVLDDT